MDRQSRKSLIDDLAGDLSPVRPLRQRDGMALVLGALAVSVIAVVAIGGVRAGLGSSMPSANFLIANLLLLGLGLAAGTAVISMAAPQVGNRYDAPRWAMAMTAVLPLGAIATLIGQHHIFHDVESGGAGWLCFGYGTLTGLFTAAALVAWLRRGAPASPQRAGFWTGIAAGALGSAAYGLHCPVDTLAHLGIWHVAPVALFGLAGRIAIPPLLRW